MAQARLAVAVLPLALWIVPALIVRAPNRPEETGGAGQASGGRLDVRLHPTGEATTPPAEMLLTDPRRRRVGVIPTTGSNLFEVPGASYELESLSDSESGAPGPRTTVLWLPDPPAGKYGLEVFGTGAGHYALEVQALDKDLAPSRAVRLDVPTSPGAVDCYVILYSPRSGSHVTLTGPARCEDVPRHLPRGLPR